MFEEERKTWDSWRACATGQWERYWEVDGGKNVKDLGNLKVYIGRKVLKVKI